MRFQSGPGDGGSRKENPSEIRALKDAGGKRPPARNLLAFTYAGGGEGGGGGKQG